MKRGLFDDLQEGGVVTVTKAPEPLEPLRAGGGADRDGGGADRDGGFEQLEDLIGSEAAWKVAGVFAGSTIYIPKSILTNKNYFNIRRKYKAGSSYRELAVEFGYTETHIRNIIHRKKENT